MAFPDAHLGDRDGGNSGAQTMSHTVNMPGNIVAGDLLVVLFNAENGEAGSWPGGWTELHADEWLVVRHRTATGGEGASITVTTSASIGSAHTSYRVSGWNSIEETANVVGTNSTTPNPPSHTASYGAKDTLWIAGFGEANGTRSVSTYPSSYTNGRNDRWNDALGTGIGSAVRQANTATEDPGTFTLSANDVWHSITIAIEPSAAGGPTDVTFVDGATATSVTNTVSIAKADLAGLSDGDVVVVHLGAHVSDATGWTLSGWTQADLKNTS